MALKFQPPQTDLTKTPEEALANAIPGGISQGASLIYQFQDAKRKREIADMEHKLRMREFEAKYGAITPTGESVSSLPGMTPTPQENQAMTFGDKLRAIGTEGVAAETSRIKAENQPQYVVPMYDAQGNVTGYSEVPRGMKPFGGKQPQKEDTKKTDKVGAQSRVTNNLKELKNLYSQLSEKGAIVDPSKGGLSNILARSKSSQVGQFTGGVFGTEEQSIRNSIKQIQPLLIQDIRQATQMGARGLDSEKELMFYLQAATDPSRDIKSNLKALDVLDKAYGLGLGINETTGLKVGDMEGGYKYIGGDPSDPKSWEKE